MTEKASSLNKFAFLPLSMLILAACGPTFVPAQGTVTLDGKPLGEATISFIPEATLGGPDAPRQSSDLTDGEGRFTLRANDRIGAIPGKYKVVLTKRVMDPQNPGFANMIEKVPQKYTIPNKSPIVLEVPPQGDENLKVELTSGP